MKLVIGFFGILLIALILFLCLGAPLEMGRLFFQIAFGWMLFLFNRLFQIQINGEVLFGSLLGFVCLFLVFHWVMKGFYNRSDETGVTIRAWPLRWTSAMIAMLLFMFISGIAAIGITHQTVWLIRSPEPFWQGGRDAMARTMSMNNLKQIGLAAQNYEDSNRILPPGSLIDSKGIPLHGWQTLLLPYLEQETLFKQIDLQRSWRDERNQIPISTEVSSFYRAVIDPRKDEKGYALSHYAGNLHVLGGDRKRTLKDFERGASNTIYVGEVFANFKPWGHPLNYRDPKLGLNRSPEGFGSGNRHPTQFSMLDGSVRWFTSDIDPEFLELLSGKPMK